MAPFHFERNNIFFHGNVKWNCADIKILASCLFDVEIHIIPLLPGLVGMNFFFDFVLFPMRGRVWVRDLGATIHLK